MSGNTGDPSRLVTLFREVEEATTNGTGWGRSMRAYGVKTGVMVIYTEWFYVVNSTTPINRSSSMEFIPGVKIVSDINNGFKLE